MYHTEFVMEFVIQNVPCRVYHGMRHTECIMECVLLSMSWNILYRMCHDVYHSLGTKTRLYHHTILSLGGGGINVFQGLVESSKMLLKPI